MGSQADSFTMLLKLQSQSWKYGTPMSVEQIVTYQPDLLDEEVLQLIYAEFLYISAKDPDYDAKNYLRRFPLLRDSLERLFQLNEYFPKHLPSDDPTSTRHNSPGLTPDTLINERYRIRRLIGQGGMGVVYEAVDERTDTRIALKQCTMSGVAMANAFKKEARILSQLRHRALPRVLDSFSDGSTHFIVMTLVEGPSLYELLLKEGRIHIPVVMWWALDLLDVLKYLHNQEPPVIHRDIKPHNIKIRPRRGLVLLDFGLAKGGVTSAGANVSVSTHGFSFAYAPLEQLHSFGTNPRSDIYSLGATLVHLITGEPPVDVISRASCVLNGRDDPLRTINASRCFPKLEAMLLQMLAISMDDRPLSLQSIEDVVNQTLLEYLEPIPVAPPTFGHAIELPQDDEGSFSTEDSPQSADPPASRRGPLPGSTYTLGNTSTSEAPVRRRRFTTETGRTRTVTDESWISSSMAKAISIHDSFKDKTLLWINNKPSNVREASPLCGILKSFGATLDVAASYSAALSVFDPTRHVVIISDIRRDITKDDLCFLESPEITTTAVPLFYFIEHSTLKRVVPSGATGIATSGEELLGLICDVFDHSVDQA